MAKRLLIELGSGKRLSESRMPSTRDYPYGRLGMRDTIRNLATLRIRHLPYETSYVAVVDVEEIVSRLYALKGLEHRARIGVLHGNFFFARIS